KHPDKRSVLARKAREDAAGRFTREAYGGEVFRRLTAIRAGETTGAPISSLLAPSIIRILWAMLKETLARAELSEAELAQQSRLAAEALARANELARGMAEALARAERAEAAALAASRERDAV